VSDDTVENKVKRAFLIALVLQLVLEVFIAVTR
jgi:hypothetical protein